MSRAFYRFFTLTPGTLSQIEALMFPGGGRRRFQCPTQVHASLIPSVSPGTLSDGAL